jgi:hypothetical protein
MPDLAFCLELIICVLNKLRTGQIDIETAFVIDPFTGVVTEEGNLWTGTICQAMVELVQRCYERV